MHIFKASTQYDDWNGTIAADEQGNGDFTKALYSASGVKSGDFIISVEASFNETSGLEMVAVVLEGAGSYDEAMDKLDTPDPLELKRVTFNLDPSEFLKLFKRLNLHLLRKGMNLDERAYYAD